MERPSPPVLATRTDGSPVPLTEVLTTQAQAARNCGLRRIEKVLGRTAEHLKRLEAYIAHLESQCSSSSSPSTATAETASELR